MGAQLRGCWHAGVGWEGEDVLNWAPRSTGSDLGVQPQLLKVRGCVLAWGWARGLPSKVRPSSQVIYTLSALSWTPIAQNKGIM